MEEQPPIWRVAENIYFICSCRQPTRGGLPAWGLGGVLTIPHRINILCYETYNGASDLD